MKMKNDLFIFITKSIKTIFYSIWLLPLFFVVGFSYNYRFVSEAKVINDVYKLRMSLYMIGFLYLSCVWLYWSYQIISKYSKYNGILLKPIKISTNKVLILIVTQVD